MDARPIVTDQPSEASYKRLAIWTVGYWVAYIAIALGSGYFVKIAQGNSEFLKFFVNFRGGVLFPFLLFFFGYFLSRKTELYKKFSIFAVSMGLAISVINFIFAKSFHNYDLITLLSNLIYLFAGFFVGHEGKNNEIGKIRKITYLILLILLISAGVFQNQLLALPYVSYIIFAPLSIANFLGILSSTYGPFYLGLIWFVYYTLLLYFILLKRKWFYIVPAIVFHVVLSGISVLVIYSRIGG